MKQADLGLNPSTKRTRKREFLDEMNSLAPWAELVELVAIYAPEGKNGRPPFPTETMLPLNFISSSAQVLYRSLIPLSYKSTTYVTRFGTKLVAMSLQQWFTLSDLATEVALHDLPLFRVFMGMDNWETRLPDESTILRFRHLLEKHKLSPQILSVVNDLLRRKGLLL